MSRNVDLDKPLSAEDRAYLLSRAGHWDVQENDRRFGNGEFAEDHEPEFKPNYTVASNPVEEGSDADSPPKFVGQRPYGVDRGVWGGSTGLSEQEVLAGSTGLSEQEALAGEAGEPHSAQEQEVDIEDLNVEELKAELKKRELPVSGNKDELQDRLKEALEKE